MQPRYSSEGLQEKAPLKLREEAVPRSATYWTGVSDAHKIWTLARQYEDMGPLSEALARDVDFGQLPRKKISDMDKR